jgi:hypothetical protein
LKPKMTQDKVQLVATAAVSPQFKCKWLTWWNSSTLTREALHFPPSGVSDRDFEAWLNRASF